MNDQATESLAACAALPVFQHLSRDECQQLLSIARRRAFAPGEQVIEQGQRSQQLWILLEGNCEVVKQGGQDGPLVLAQLVPHSVFGEMSFFSPAPHSASVVAKTQVRLLSIPRLEYDGLVARGDSAAYKLAYYVVQSLADRLRRMDDWVAQLMATSDPPDKRAGDGQREWQQFRQKLFESWNL